MIRRHRARERHRFQNGSQVPGSSGPGQQGYDGEATVGDDSATPTEQHPIVMPDRFRRRVTGDDLDDDL